MATRRSTAFETIAFGRIDPRRPCNFLRNLFAQNPTPNLDEHDTVVVVATNPNQKYRGELSLSALA